MECVHLKEQPELHTQAYMHLYSEILEQVILKRYLARVQIVKCKRTWSDLDAGVWMYWRRMEIPHSRYPCLRFVYLGEF
jgi:hypothetical protein